MRIVYDSKQHKFKTPFGTMTPGKVCTVQNHVPTPFLTKRIP